MRNERSRRHICAAERLLEERDLNAALDHFEDAEALGFDANRCGAGRWLAQMLLGEFQAAWRESDAIRSRTPREPNRLWSGESLQSRQVMLRCLHGLGDAVQFLRFAPQLQAMASHLIVEVPPKLLELAPMLDGVEHVITWDEQAPTIAPKWDVQIEINELAHMFRVELSELRLERNISAFRHTLRRATSLRRLKCNPSRWVLCGPAESGTSHAPSRSMTMHQSCR